MRKFLVLIILLVGVALIGVNRGWFKFGTDHDGDSSKVTVTVDKSKIHDDEARAAEKVHEATGKVADLASQHK